MNEPLVSILMPAFNAERWITAALDSALAQTWRHTEIIVVDDGSTDGTAAVVARFKPHGVKLIQQDNLGQCAAENRAFRESRGDLIQYLDADDVLSPDKIARQVARIGQARDVVAWGDWGRFRAHPSEAVFQPARDWPDLDPVEWLIRTWTGGAPMMPNAMWLIPRPVVLQAGPWDERLSVINDFDYFTRILLASKAVFFCRGARFCYRSGHAPTLSGRTSAAAWDSALLSLELGTAALLQRDNSARARQACADVFQEWSYTAYLHNDSTFRRATAHVASLGGSGLVMQGGAAFRALRHLVGWKVAKRVKVLAHRHGFGRISRWKASLTGQRRGRPE